MRVLITGGCGFLGSHQAVALIEAGHSVVLLDDLSNSRYETIERIARITDVVPTLYHTDVRDVEAVTRCLLTERCDAIIHFAARKHVAESVDYPIDYYSSNVTGLLSIIQAARAASVRTLVFSSSGSIYGETATVPIPETHPANPTNPYSASKTVGERILRDLAVSEPGWKIALLRYFNPAGAHPSGLLGEDPSASNRNLVPILMEVAAGTRAEVCVYGDDFATPDGTAIRDYVHVLDVVDAHTAALTKMHHSTVAQPELSGSQSDCVAINIGTGRGVSVLELIRAAGRASNRCIPFTIQGRRHGDVSCLVADVSESKRLLSFVCSRTPDDICADAWKWQQSMLTIGDR